MNAADISPVPSAARTQSGVDLFIIFAGANIVATTLQVGAALAGDFSPEAALVLMAAGATAGFAARGGAGGARTEAGRAVGRSPPARRSACGARGWWRRCCT